MNYFNLKNITLVAVAITIFFIAMSTIKIVEMSQGKITEEASNIPSSETYKMVVKLCGKEGVFDLDWADFDKGEIKSLYCNRR